MSRLCCQHLHCRSLAQDLRRLHLFLWQSHANLIPVLLGHLPRASMPRIVSEADTLNSMIFLTIPPARLNYVNAFPYVDIIISSTVVF